ncbi:MAG: hypothetical protein U0518_05125 [Candidatus Gracilibacteria bacterium]
MTTTAVIPRIPTTYFPVVRFLGFEKGAIYQDKHSGKTHLLTTLGNVPAQTSLQRMLVRDDQGRHIGTVLIPAGATIAL